jgi:hypothetical protein
MPITPRTRSQCGALLCAILCIGVTTGCRKHTLPWEHPTAFNKTPACDETGPCGGDGCYVPPPPVMNSDCYGYQFTCWHPWPEHCQPQCNDGMNGPCATVAPHSAEPMPTMMPEMAPTMPPSEPPLPSSAPPASSPPASSPPASSTPASLPPANENQTWTRPRYERPQPAISQAARDGTREAANTPSSSTRDGGRSPNYAFMSAVSDSNAGMRDDSVRPVSSVTRLQSPGTSGGNGARPNDASNGQSQPAPNGGRDGLERFRW